MPIHLRALVVILVLAATTFAIVKAPVRALSADAGDFERRRNLWIAITLAAFLAHNFWLYIIFVVVLLRLAAPRETNKLALYFFVLFAVPMFARQIPGVGPINQFFEINYARLLALMLLLPAYLAARKQPDVVAFGRALPDKMLIGYLMINFGLIISSTATLTVALRQGILYPFMDVFLPYYVASRTVKSLDGFRDVLMSFVVAALVLGAIGVFEAASHWLLYANLDDAMGFRWALGGYLERAGAGLRAQASTGQPIILGYVMAVALGFYLYLGKLIPGMMLWATGLAVLAGGLISALSRGPWAGAVLMVLVFTMAGRAPLRRLTQLGVCGFLGAAALLATPVADKIMDLLPFIGTHTGETAMSVSYRQRLLDIGISVILQNPIFGSPDFYTMAETTELKQGSGLIDLVNTYLAIGLANGLIGLSLFTGVFLASAAGIFKAMRSLPDRNSELYVLGQALLATVLGIMLIIFTVSSISVTALVYWSVAGLGIGYARMVALAKAKAPVRLGEAEKASAAATPPRFRSMATKNR